jgi:uncharacterized protein YndB with AHSA1/START domain
MKTKEKELEANAKITVNAPIERVWDAFVNPDTIKKYMFGTTVTSDFKEGSTITWKGEWNGKAYEDKGKIIKVKPMSQLQYTHFSPLAGGPDAPENYHNVTVKLTPMNGSTTVFLSQDNNATDEERKHSEKNWAMMLSSLKEILEGNHN